MPADVDPENDLARSPGDAAWARHLDVLAQLPVSDERAALRAVAAETRRVIDHLVRTDASIEKLQAAAASIASVADALAVPRPDAANALGLVDALAGGDAHAFFDHSPMLGMANPIAPPIALSMEGDDTVIGTVTFGAAYEGPPGCVHGGYIAAAFDEVLGSAQSLSGSPGMTGRLSIDYRSPTPLHEPIRFVGRFERTEGRKVFTSGESSVGDRICAEAQGLFISIDFARFAAQQRGQERER